MCWSKAPRGWVAAPLDASCGEVCRHILLAIAHEDVVDPDDTNVETAAVHFEKALRAYKGLYQVVNRETARAILAHGFHLINREEDMGDAGLRQAKLSYAPLDITPVYDLTPKTNMDHGGRPAAAA
ncbi:MAG: phosphatidylglycerol lysyltransferase domain-containing protein [Paracoccaceae bacterium]